MHRGPRVPAGGRGHLQDGRVLTVATVNVNGIRAAARRGMGRWLADRAPDVLCLQEVRADDAVLCELLEQALGGRWRTISTAHS